MTNFDFGTVAGRKSEKTVDDWIKAYETLPPTLFTQFKMGTIFDPGFTVNKRLIVCPLPCRAACERDFTSFKRLKDKVTA